MTRLIAYCSTIAAFAVSFLSQTLPGPAQPLPYSHKTHVALGLECGTCHVNPAPGKLMTFPPTTLCMECHKALAAERPSIQKLAAFAASGKPIPWVRVYQTPDYVFWKHTTHLKAGVTCAECHGPVAERDVIKQETNVVTMAGCMACHDKRQVLTDCGDCHAPRQSLPRGFAPRTPRHALSRAASPARSVRVAHSLPLVRGHR